MKRFLAAYSRGVDDYNAARVDKTMGEVETAAIVWKIHQYVYADQPPEKAGPRIRHGAMRIDPNARLNVESVKDQLDWFRAEGMVREGVAMDGPLDAPFVATWTVLSTSPDRPVRRRLPWRPNTVHPSAEAIRSLQGDSRPGRAYKENL